MKMQDALMECNFARACTVRVRPNSAQPFSRQQESRLHRRQRLQQEEMHGGRYVRYTCRFEIAIADDLEFRVVRRLFGANGCNMIRIKEMCGGEDEHAVKRSGETVKLFLRGKGSGFREGPMQVESQEPLSINVQSRFYDKYRVACDLVQELILNVYEEYKVFCAKFQRKPANDFDMMVKKEETASRPEPIPELPPNIFEGGIVPNI